MTKKVWEKPEVKELNVKATEYGTTVTTTVDGVFHASETVTFFSFASAS